jgi:WD40 repeat protein
MKTIHRSINLLIVLAFLITGCTSKTFATATVEDVENAVHILPTETKIPPIVIPSETAVNLPVQNTDTPVPARTDAPALIGTPIPENSEIIGVNNFGRLKLVGQWGRGSLQGVSFTPEGKSFIAISELGWTIYNMDTLDQPPQWAGFDEPLLFDEFAFSSDGKTIKFSFSDYQRNTVQIRSFPSGEIIENPSGGAWLEPDVTGDYSNMILRSPDGTKVFKSSLSYEFNEQVFSEEKTVREMHDANHNLLFALRDDAPYVTYSDRNGPEGCDLSVFSPCGNALMSVATTPVKAMFSPDSSTFAALYEPPSLYSGIMKAFSYIRIYNSSNGDLLGSLGGFTKPIQDFAYSPDGKMLVAGFVDGSVILWDIKSAKNIFGTRHMNAPVWKVVYSYDSRYLLIQRAEEVEVRLTTNGALLYRFDAVEFAVSPVTNLLALGDNEGNIQIRDIDTGQSVRGIKAHEDRVYSIAFSQDGFYLASSGRDCDIKLWDLESGKLLHYFEETAVDAYQIGSPSRIFSTYLEFIPDKHMLIGFGSWGTVINWNVNSGASNYAIQSSAIDYYGRQRHCVCVSNYIRDQGARRKPLRPHASV